MILHIILSAEARIPGQLKNMINESDGILLAGDGAYLANTIGEFKNPLYIREKDAMDRGISNTRLSLISDNEWVKLTLQYDKTLSWL